MKLKLFILLSAMLMVSLYAQEETIEIEEGRRGVAPRTGTGVRSPGTVPRSPSRPLPRPTPRPSNPRPTTTTRPANRPPTPTPTRPTTTRPRNRTNSSSNSHSSNSNGNQGTSTPPPTPKQEEQLGDIGKTLLHGERKDPLSKENVLSLIEAGQTKSGLREDGGFKKSLESLASLNSFLGNEQIFGERATKYGDILAYLGHISKEEDEEIARASASLPLGKLDQALGGNGEGRTSFDKLDNVLTRIEKLSKLVKA